MKITAHKTFKNKFDLIRAGIKFIYRQNTCLIGYSVFRQTNKNISPPIRTWVFFHAAMQANIFSIKKTHQNNYFILAGDFIHSLA